MLVYTRQSEVLLLQRADDETYWQSVTGALEVNETPADAARRELLEETGLDCPVKDHQCSTVFEIKGLWRKRYQPEHTHNREHLFSVLLDTPVDITLNPDEHHGHLWMPASEAFDRVISATNRNAIEDIALPEQYRK